MLVVQLLLPRFLVVEVVFLIHFLQESQACSPSKSNSKRETGLMKKIYCLVPVGRGAIREEPLFYDLDGKVSKVLHPLQDRRHRGFNCTNGFLRNQPKRFNHKIMVCAPTGLDLFSLKFNLYRWSEIDDDNPA